MLSLGDANPKTPAKLKRFKPQRNLCNICSKLLTEAPASQKGTSFGLYRTFGNLGAILAGSQLKTLFPHGVTAASFAVIPWYALACGVALTLLYLPLLLRKNVLPTP